VNTVTVSTQHPAARLPSAIYLSFKSRVQHTYQGARRCRWCSAGLAGSCQPGNVRAPQPAGSLLLEPGAEPDPYQNLCRHRAQFASCHQNRCTWLTRQHMASGVQVNCGICCTLYQKVHERASGQMTQTHLHQMVQMRN